MNLDRLVEIEETLTWRNGPRNGEFYASAAPIIQELIHEIYRLRAHIAVLENDHEYQSKETST